MTDSYRSELLEQTDHIFKSDLCGRAVIRDVVNRLTQNLPEGAADYYVRKGITGVVQSYFRTKGADGLPQAPQVNAAGEHVQLELLTVDDYRYLARQYLDRSHANRAQAEKVAARCSQIYSVALDLDQMAESA